jgi:hypothetical protein
MIFFEQAKMIYIYIYIEKHKNKQTPQHKAYQEALPKFTTGPDKQQKGDN